MIYKINFIYLKQTKVGRLSDIATQFRVDKSDIVRPIYKLGKRREHLLPNGRALRLTHA